MNGKNTKNTITSSNGRYKVNVKAVKKFFHMQDDALYLWWCMIVMQKETIIIK